MTEMTEMTDVTTVTAMTACADAYVVSVLSVAMRAIRRDFGDAATFGFSPAHVEDGDELDPAHFYVLQIDEPGCAVDEHGASERGRAARSVLESILDYQQRWVATILNKVVTDAAAWFKIDDLFSVRIFVSANDEDGGLIFTLDIPNSPGCEAHPNGERADECEACDDLHQRCVVDDEGAPWQSAWVTTPSALVTEAQESASTWRAQMRKELAETTTNCDVGASSQSAH